MGLGGTTWRGLLASCLLAAIVVATIHVHIVGVTAADSIRIAETQEWLILSNPDPHPPEPSNHSNDSCHCPHPSEHHESLFQLDSVLDNNPVVLSILFVLVTGLSFFFEKLTHFIEHKTEKHHHIAELVTAVYREVMLLGFISLVLFVIQQTGLRDVEFEPGHAFDAELFEFIHIFIFFSAIFFIIVVLVLLVLIRGTWKRWRSLQARSKQEILDGYAEAKAQRDSAGRCWCLNPCLVARYAHARQNKQFYLVRARFIDTQITIRYLPGQVTGVLRPKKHLLDSADHRRVSEKSAVSGGSASSTSSHTDAAISREQIEGREADTRMLQEQIAKFDFGKYLRRSVRHDVLDILEIDWRVWLVIMMVALGNIARIKWAGEFHSPDRGYRVFVAVGFFFLLSFAIVYWTMRKKLYDYYTLLKRTTRAGELMYEQLGRPSTIEAGGEAKSSDKRAAGGSTSLGHVVADMPTPTRQASLDDSVVLQGPVVRDDAQLDQKKFFWFNSPVFMLRVIQILVLVECFYMALYLLVFVHRIALITEDYSGVVTFLLHILAIAPPMLLIFGFLPLVLPVYSLLAHVESMTDRKHLRYILTYDERVKARKAAHDADDDDDLDDDENHHHFGQRASHHADPMDEPLLPGAPPAKK